MIFKAYMNQRALWFSVSSGGWEIPSALNWPFKVTLQWWCREDSLEVKHYGYFKSFQAGFILLMLSKILLGCFSRFQQRSEFPRTSGTEGGRRTDKRGERTKDLRPNFVLMEPPKTSKHQSCVNSLWAELRRLRRKSSTAAFGLFTGIGLLAYVQVLGFDGRTRNSFFSSIRVLYENRAWSQRCGFFSECRW